MSTIDFFTLWVDGHLVELLICLIFATFIYIFVYHKLYVSALDPFFFSTILSLCGCGVVFFLFYSGAIQKRYFLSYSFTQIAFMLGVLLHNKQIYKVNLMLRFKNEYDLAKVAYIIVVSSVVICQLMVYRNVGFPIFMDSRLELGASNGGIGIILRLINVWGMIALLLSFYFLERKSSYKYIACFYLVFFLITSILSGSKSNFWNLISGFFLYAVLFSPNLFVNIKKMEMLFILLGFIAASLVIFINVGTDPLQSVSLLLERFIISGDVYWETYPNGFVEILKKRDPIVTLFTDIVTAYRLIPFKELPESMGIEIYRLHTDTNILVGPNPRHNIMGYVFWGMYGSVCFSFFLGWVVGWVRKLFYSVDTRSKSIFNKIFIALCYSVIWGLESDVSYTVGRLNSVFMMCSFLVLILFIWCVLLFLWNKFCFHFRFMQIRLDK